MDRPSQNPALDFANADGSPSTWVEELPDKVRHRAFFMRIAVGVAVAMGIWALQISNNVFEFERGLIGLIPLAIGAIAGYAAYRPTEARRYSTTRRSYAPRQRLNRAWPWWATGAAAFTVIWSMQYSGGTLAEYWWYAWPFLFPWLVGTGLYLLREETVLTPAAAKAKSAFDAAEVAAKAAGKNPGVFEEIVNSAIFRYPFAALCAYGVYYFGVVAEGKNTQLTAVICAGFAMLAAHEISKWLLGLAAVGLLIWGVVAGISALPLSAAIIIGALIIAGALK